LKQAGMTQTELANRLSLSPQMVSNYVRNIKLMSLEIAESVAQILNITTYDLYEWEIDDERHTE
jgi:transcriptional regulator with XRE-family HTH domain